ncbi:MAG: hypothetical protein H0X31_17025 [Nostocaceae cyanobacterium]|nr:hypothetical protein [Nostocaceae cyanobacterium]
MKAYKIKGQINPAVSLIITESVEILTADMEVIVLQQVAQVEAVDNSQVLVSELQPEIPKITSKIKAFQGLFENAPAVPLDYDADQARWEALMEKYNL